MPCCGCSTVAAVTEAGHQQVIGQELQHLGEVVRPARLEVNGDLVGNGRRDGGGGGQLRDRAAGAADHDQVLAACPADSAKARKPARSAMPPSKRATMMRGVGFGPGQGGGQMLRGRDFAQAQARTGGKPAGSLGQGRVQRQQVGVGVGQEQDTLRPACLDRGTKGQGGFNRRSHASRSPALRPRIVSEHVLGQFAAAAAGSGRPRASGRCSRRWGESEPRC